MYICSNIQIKYIVPIQYLVQHIRCVLGEPVFVSDSSFSLNEYWSDGKQHNVGDSRRDEGYLELQWDLPKDMSLAEKFVLRFDELTSKHGINISDNVFKVT